MQDNPYEHLHPSLAGSRLPGDNRRPQTMTPQPCSSHSGSWLAYAQQKLEVSPWGVTHLTCKDESLLYFRLANLGQLSTQGPPGLGLWLMYAYYPRRDCCYQNSAFPNLLFLCRHSCWVRLHMADMAVVTQGLPSMPWDLEDPHTSQNSQAGNPIMDKETSHGQRVTNTVANWNIQYPPWEGERESSKRNVNRLPISRSPSLWRWSPHSLSLSVSPIKTFNFLFPQ
jgi:hypothetical protein